MGTSKPPQTLAAPAFHRDASPGHRSWNLFPLGTCSQTAPFEPPSQPVYPGLLPACLFPSADLSVDEQRGRRAMKVVRVLSVSPTFHKLETVGSTELQLEHHLLPICPPQPPVIPQPHPHCPLPPTPQGLHAASALSSRPLGACRPHGPPAPSPAPVPCPHVPHLMACSWLREGRHFEKIPRIRSSTFQPAEGRQGRHLGPEG